MSFVPASATFTGKFRVDRSPDEAFPLFSPLGERAWVPNWEPELLYPAGAEWEAGLVFRTLHEGQESIWFVASLDRQARSVTYHRVDLGLTAVTVNVVCEESGAGATDVTVRYTFVGITDAGNAFVAARNDAEFAAKMRQWQEAIARV